MLLTIGGEQFFDVNSFAKVTNRTPQTVRRYITFGNKIRKLQVVRIAGKPLIPWSELLRYPFTVCGKNNTEVYHYDENGRVVEA